MSLIFSLVVLYFGQDRIIYQNSLFSPYAEYPEENEKGKRSPAEKNMNFTDITVETEDDLRLSGWLIYQEKDMNKRPTIVYMHENSGNIGNKLAWAENIYFNLKYNIVLVGYRGYGHSEGSPSEKGLQLDSKAIIKWTLENKQIDTSQVYVFGNGLGGAAALFGVQSFQDSVKGLILQNAFLNMANGVDDCNWLFRLLRPLILANYWENDKRIKDITFPILFISGLETKTHDDMQNLRDLATSSPVVQFLNVPKGTKANTWRMGGRSYIVSISEFIEKTKGLINLSLETESSE